jgi:hypothetical protein
MDFNEHLKSMELADKLNVNFTKEQLIMLSIALLKETFINHEAALKFINKQIERDVK